MNLFNETSNPNKVKMAKYATLEENNTQLNESSSSSNIKYDSGNSGFVKYAANLNNTSKTQKLKYKSSNEYRWCTLRVRENDYNLSSNSYISLLRV